MRIHFKIALLAVVIVAVAGAFAQNQEAGTTTLLFFATLAFYFIPTFVAISRGHGNRNAICAVNLFLGWSLLGWVAALVWSLTDPGLPAEAAPAPAPADRKKCPQCAEWVQPDAKICKHCGSTFAPPAKPPAPVAAPAPPTAPDTRELDALLNEPAEPIDPLAELDATLKSGKPN